MKKLSLMLCFVTSAPYFYLISPAEVRSLWAQLRRDEPHLLSNFEDFLARVTSQIIEANQEKTEMESALKRSGEIIFVYLIISQQGGFVPFSSLHLRSIWLTKDEP